MFTLVQAQGPADRNLDLQISWTHYFRSQHPDGFAPARLQETTRRFLADSPLVLGLGVVAMTAGLAIVNTHDVWVVSWPVIVTLFGWALAISSAARVAAPVVVDEVGTAMLDRPTLTRVVGIVRGLLGIFLTFKGYA